MIQSGATTLGQSGPETDDNEGVITFPKAPALLEPHHQIVLCHIQDTCWGCGLTPLQLSSQYIQNPR